MEEKRRTFVGSAGQRTCIICGRRSATVSRWLCVFATVASQGGLRLNCFRLAAKLSRRGETASKPPRFIYANFCTHAITREKTVVAALLSWRWKDGTNRSLSLNPSTHHRHFFETFVYACVQRALMHVFTFFLSPCNLSRFTFVLKTQTEMNPWTLIFEINFRRTNYTFFVFFSALRYRDGISNFWKTSKKYFLSPLHRTEEYYSATSVQQK